VLLECLLQGTALQGGDPLPGAFLGVEDLQFGLDPFPSGQPAGDQVHGQLVGPRDDPDPLFHSQSADLLFQDALFLEVWPPRGGVVLPQHEELQVSAGHLGDQVRHHLHVAPTHGQILLEDRGRDILRR
jgi:hypothetical protein